MGDYLKRGEQIVLEMRKPDKERTDNITISQIRKFLASVNSIRNKMELPQNRGEKLSKEIMDEVKYMHLKLVYQAGREKSVKKFYNMIKDDIEGIKDNRTKLIEFMKLMESVVAYHKYYGGKD